ncbi:hypothetical protein [Pseudohalioglobus lutimaris]|uniref:Uncharacterized protein n=1 Tax=Pseudohalioglobus lutimaris TaxID=1737061 RepID=A0A2N5X4S5_9GAMM|nr:hypothetical protein [Pseudohalioglobus lutimaris]PLW69486.1 hypothetical protein C0039_08160 [Pseudohalioglobus lutimaris]
MSSARGRANQCLYLARILTAAWQRDLAAETIPASVLAQAYLPCVRSHLRDAYGWFLVEVTRPGVLPDLPPTCIAELPEVAQGKAVPPEVREFHLLEGSGWIAEMLAADADSATSASSMGNLATAVTAADPQRASQWADLLQALFDRMGDSLDEC